MEISVYAIRHNAQLKIRLCMPHTWRYSTAYIQDKTCPAASFPCSQALQSRRLTSQCLYIYWHEVHAIVQPYMVGKHYGCLKFMGQKWRWVVKQCWTIFMYTSANIGREWEHLRDVIVKTFCLVTFNRQ